MSSTLPSIHWVPQLPHNTKQNQGSHGALSWPLFWPLIVYLREVKALITLELNSTVNRRVNTTKYEYECVCAVICIRV